MSGTVVTIVLASVALGVAVGLGLARAGRRARRASRRSGNAEVAAELRAVRHSQKLETVGTLVAGVAHELANPLSFVRANLVAIRATAARVLVETDPLEEKLAEELRELPDVVDECLDGIDRIARVVTDLRRFSRIPDGEMLPMDVNAALRDALRLASFHPDRGAVVDVRLDPTLPAVPGSAERLVHVFLNLLVNARQALRERADGRILVTSAREGDCVVVRVSDNGDGVPPALRSRIFEPFFTTKQPEDGTGLGLAIARDLVREHGGTLRLATAPEGGALFELHLPLH